MAAPTRVQALSIGRITDTAADIEAGVLGDGIFGTVTNVVKPAIMLPHNDGFGPAGRDRYWNNTVELGDFSFDLLSASEAPESLGPVDLFFDVYETRSDGKTAIMRVVGKLQEAGTGTWDRTTDYPRTMTVYPYRRIDGGGGDLKDLTKANASVYLDTKTGEYLTREGGTGTQVDHFAEIRKAHGVA